MNPPRADSGRNGAAAASFDVEDKYDLIREGAIAVVVVALLVLALNVLFGAPLVHGVSFQSWANADPKDFVATTITELAGTGATTVASSGSEAPAATD